MKQINIRTFKDKWNSYRKNPLSLIPVSYTHLAQLENEGTEIPGTITSATLQAASNTANLAATAIIEVSSAPVTITLNAHDNDAEYSNTSVVIRKLD